MSEAGLGSHACSRWHTCWARQSSSWAFYSSLKRKQKTNSILQGWRKDGSEVKNTCHSCRGPWSVPSTHVRSLTTACNSERLLVKAISGVGNTVVLRMLAVPVIKTEAGVDSHLANSNITWVILKIWGLWAGFHAQHIPTSLSIYISTHTTHTHYIHACTHTLIHMYTHTHTYDNVEEGRLQKRQRINNLAWMISMKGVTLSSKCQRDAIQWVRLEQLQEGKVWGRRFVLWAEPWVYFSNKRRLRVREASSSPRQQALCSELESSCVRSYL